MGSVAILLELKRVHVDLSLLGVVVRGSLVALGFLKKVVLVEILAVLGFLKKVELVGVVALRLVTLAWVFADRFFGII